MRAKNRRRPYRYYGGCREIEMQILPISLFVSAASANFYITDHKFHLSHSFIRVTSVPVLENLRSSHARKRNNNQPTKFPYERHPFSVCLELRGGLGGDANAKISPDNIDPKHFAHGSEVSSVVSEDSSVPPDEDRSPSSEPAADDSHTGQGTTPPLQTSIAKSRRRPAGPSSNRQAVVAAARAALQAAASGQKLPARVMERMERRARGEVSEEENGDIPIPRLAKERGRVKLDEEGEEREEEDESGGESNGDAEGATVVAAAQADRIAASRRERMGRLEAARAARSKECLRSPVCARALATHTHARARTHTHTHAHPKTN